MIQKLRISSLIGIHLLILAHIYLFGDAIIGSLDFQEFFHSFIKFGVINAGVILVILAFITTLIFGRFFLWVGMSFWSSPGIFMVDIKKDEYNFFT